MLFMINTIDIASYADDNTIYSAGKNQCNLEKNAKAISQNS